MNKIILCSLLAVVCSPLRANDLGYASDRHGNLWLIDFTTLTPTNIGNTGQVFADLATKSDGTLFGLTDRGAIYTINQSTAVAQFVGNSGLDSAGSLDFNGNVLLGTGYSSEGQIYSFNQTNGLASLVTMPSTSTGTLASSALLDSNTLLAQGFFGPSLYRIQLSTGDTTLIGSRDIFVNGMDFIGNTLYGVGDSGKLYRINTTTGGIATLRDTGGQQYLGLTAVVDVIPTVPEPTGIILLLTGCLVMASRARTR